MQFRKDINGLRAYAVLAVIIFHFDKSWLPGGFIGVDIFFVISGYLMTGIVLRAHHNHSFSLKKFYLARIRRIIPALLVLICILIILGYLLLAPGAYYTLSKHAGSSLLFISNFIYKNEAGYFDASALSKYLLHTWSLSVEWQFYILYPIVLIALLKFLSQINFKRMLLILTISAFILNLFISNNSATSAYFLLPSRIWEMLLGGITYCYTFNIKTQRNRNLLEYLGLAIIITSLFIISEKTLWPGYMALLPTLGSFILLQANNQNSILTNNLLCQKLGLWSYSLYLYHWPILAFNYQLNLNLSIWTFLVLSLLLSIASYYLIEIRRWKLKTIGICFTITLIALISIYISKGANFRVPEKFRLTPAEYHQQYYGGSGYITPFGSGYINADNEKNFDLFLIGDSFSRQYSRFIDQQSHKIKTWTADGCLITQNYLQPSHYLEDQGQTCLEISQHAISNLKETDQDLIWIQNWDAYQHIELTSLNTLPIKQYVEIIHHEIQELTSHNNRNIFIIGSTFQPQYNSYKCLAETNLPFMQHINNSCDEHQKLNLPNINVFLKEMSNIYNNVYYIDPNEALCNNQFCMLYTQEKEPIFSDNAHLSIYGAEIVGAYIFEQILQIKSRFLKQEK